MTEGEVRTYEVVTSDGTFRIDVPANAKITFGPVIGVTGKPSYDGGSGNSLRIWEGEKIQRALFLGVKSFRDCSMPMRVKAVRLFGAENWVKDNGTWTGKRADLVEKGWVSADEIVEQAVEAVEAGEANTRWATGLRGMRPRADRAFTLESEKEEAF